MSQQKEENKKLNEEKLKDDVVKDGLEKGNAESLDQDGNATKGNEEKKNDANDAQNNQKSNANNINTPNPSDQMDDKDVNFDLKLSEIRQLAESWQLSKDQNTPLSEVTKVNSGIKYLSDLRDIEIGKGTGSRQIRIIEGRVPMIIKFQITRNSAQLKTDSYGTYSTSLSANEQIIRSGQEYSNDVAIMRPIIDLSDFGGSQISMDHYESEAGILVQTSVRGSRDTDSKRLAYRLRQLKNFISVYTSLKFNVVIKLSKEVQPHESSSNPIINNVSAMTLWKNDNPHPYLATIMPSTAAWVIEACTELYNQAPIDLGEFRVQSTLGRKDSAMAKVITDQYTAESLMATQEYLDRNRYENYELVNLHQACLLPEDVAKVNDLRLSYDTFIHRPTAFQRNAVIYYILANIKERITVLEAASTSIRSTARLVMNSNIPKVAIGSNLSGALGAELITRINTVNSQSVLDPSDILTLETFTAYHQPNISNVPNGTDEADYLSILNIILWQQMFPRLAQRMHSQLGYYLCRIISTYAPAIWIAWSEAFGAIGRVVGGQWVIESYSLRVLTVRETQSGLIYSPYFQHPMRNATPQIAAMSGLYPLLHRPVREVRLTRKRHADLPYTSEDYTSFVSWDNIEVHQAREPYFAGRLQPILQRTLAAMAAIRRIRVNTSRRAQDETAVKAIDVWLLSMASTYGPVEFTLDRLQIAIMNSPFYMHDDYVPNQVYPSQDLVLAPVIPNNDNVRDAFETRFGIPLQTVHTGVDFWAPFQMLCGCEGEFLRNYDGVSKLNSITINPLSTGATDTRRKVNTFNPTPTVNWYLNIINPGNSFITSIDLLLNVFNSNNNDNPIREFSRAVTDDIKMVNAVPLTKLILSHFGETWSSYFLDHVSGSSGVIDPRMKQIVLARINPTNNLVDYRRIPRSLIGQALVTSDDYDRRIANIARKLTMQDNQMFNRLVTGLQIGGYVVDDLDPYNVWTEEVFDRMNIIIGPENVRYETRQVKEGWGRAIIVNYEDQEFVATSPYDTTLQRFVLEIENVSDIPSTHHQLLVKLVTEKQLAVRFPYVKAVLSFSDTLEKQTDATASVSEIETLLIKIITSANVTIHDVVLPNTMMAIAYSRDARYQPKYLQWVWLLNIIERMEWASVLSDEIGRPAYGLLPPAECLGYGQGVPLCIPGTNIPKIDGPININNPIPYLTREIKTDLPEIEIIPGTIFQI